MKDTSEELKKIKQSFRLLMNGVASHSMRSKGVDYKLNWGIPLIDLQQMAVTYGKDYDLAVALWKEDIRECKILATLIMPAERMQPDLANLWMEETNTQEVAEMAAFNLYQHLDFAPDLALFWTSNPKPLYQICAYQILSRLFMKRARLEDREINEYLDQVEIALQDEHIGVRHAALNSVINFMNIGDDYEKIARNALKSLDLAFF